jgi:hypothetical protein
MDSKQIFTPEMVAHILNLADEQKRARIFESNTQRPFIIQSMVIPLDTARLDNQPLKIGFPFKALWIQDATDSSVVVNIRAGGRDLTNSPFKLRLNDVWKLDDPIAEAYLDWSAQSGKSITILFSLTSDFTSGRNVSVNSGGVSINEGDSFTTAQVTMTAATATLIKAQNSSRKVLAVQNNTGADLWVGGLTVSNTGATQGIKVPANGIYYWRNTAALYGYSVAGGAGDSGITYMEEI